LASTKTLAASAASAIKMWRTSERSQSLPGHTDAAEVRTPKIALGIQASGQVLAVRLGGVVFLHVAGHRARGAADRRADRTGDHRAADRADGGLLFGGGVAGAEGRKGGGDREQAERLAYGFTLLKGE
jgi:hypothetical protein